MSWLTLMGWNVPVLDGSGKRRAPEIIGGAASRSHHGSLRGTQRADKRPWDFQTGYLDEDDADTLEHLLLGHAYTLDWSSGLYAAVPGGLGPNAGYSGVSLVTSSPSPVHGTYSLKLASGGTSTITYATQLNSTDGWAVSLWISVAGGAWHHYYQDSNDGALKDNSSTSDVFTVVSSGSSSDISITLQGHHPDSDVTTSHIYVSQMFLMRFIPSTSFVTSALYGGGSGSVGTLPAAPQLNAAGDFIRESSATVLGELADQQYVQARIDSTGFEPNLRTVSFALREI